MVPKPVRDRFRRLLWEKADEMDWGRRPALERASTYENWAKDKEIGGVLAHYMDPRKVRVYIKDTLMKPYQRTRLRDDFEQVLSALEIIPSEIEIQESFHQPHGCLLSDGRIICWGTTRNWKDVLFSVFERTYAASSAAAFAAVLIDVGGASEEEPMEIVVEAARRLGIRRMVRITR